MINPVSSSTRAAPAGMLGPGGQMGKQEFLQLLVTQLRYQDPLNPMKPDDFAAQLAQFSSVEQLMQINDALATQASLTELSIKNTNAAAALNVVGRNILADGSGLIVTPDGEPAVNFNLSGPAEATITVFDDKGVEVFSTTQRLEGGRNTVQIDPGVLAEGSYRFTVEATGANGAAVAVHTYTTGRVDGVRYGATGPVLLIGGVDYPLSAVVEIRP